MDPDPIQLPPMVVPKASDVLAAELRERILSGRIVAGIALPSERDLVAQTRMSRATVREALRTLEVQGLLEIRAGRNGGAFVQRPDRDDLASSIELFIRGRHVRLVALLETRESIEPACAALAARRRSPADLERLDHYNQQIDRARHDLAGFLYANVGWHLAVAEASQNELLSAFMHSISRVLHASTANEDFVTEEIRDLAVRAHMTITEAIRAGDPDAAHRRMARHVHSYADAIVGVETRREIELDEEPG